MGLPDGFLRVAFGLGIAFVAAGIVSPDLILGALGGLMIGFGSHGWEH